MKSKLLVFLTSPLTGAKCEVKAISIFDHTFDDNQRCSKAVAYLSLALTWVKGKGKVISTFDFAFDARQRLSQR